MRSLLLASLLCACGQPVDVPQACPTMPGVGVRCCDAEVALQTCVGDQRWVCEPSVGNADGGEDLRQLWERNGSCAH